MKEINGKIVVIRVDLDNYEFKYEDVKNEEGVVIEKRLAKIEFPKSEQIILPVCVNVFLEAQAKLVVLLSDYGPKTGKFEKNYSMENFIKYLQDV